MQAEQTSLRQALRQSLAVEGLITEGLFEGLERHGYKAIHADVPWGFKTFTQAGQGRSASRHYKTLTLTQIKALEVKELAAKDSHLFFWTTQPFLPEALEIMRLWGFRYSSIAFTWVKLKPDVQAQQWSPLHLAEDDLHLGLGLTTRKNSEICLLGRRGSPRRLSSKVREIILAPVREHSRKPDETYPRIEEYCAGPYLDLFARQTRSGWTCWGNETHRFPHYDGGTDVAATEGAQAPG